MCNIVVIGVHIQSLLYIIGGCGGCPPNQTSHMVPMDDIRDFTLNTDSIFVY